MFPEDTEREEHSEKTKGQEEGNEKDEVEIDSVDIEEERKWSVGEVSGDIRDVFTTISYKRNEPVIILE